MRIDVARFAVGSREWLEALELRRAVLRRPLNLDYSAADLEAERDDILFVASEGNRLAGVVMLRPDGAGGVKLRQMAVAEIMRGRGVGERLLLAFEEHARSIGADHIGLAARKTAIGFYERKGYTVDGDEFIEVTVPHRHMSKSLRGRE